jgi:hypothetical protein
MFERKRQRPLPVLILNISPDINNPKKSGIIK